MRAPARSYAIAPVLGGVELLSADYDSHTFPPHAHDTFVLATIEKGSIEVRTEGRTLRVDPGDVLLIAPGAIHSAGSPGRGAWEYRALYLTDPQCRALAGSVGEPWEVTGGAVLRDRSAAIALLETHYELSDGHLTSLDSGLTNALARLVGDAARLLRAPAPRVVASERIERVRAHIERNLHRRVTLDELARVAGISRFALVRAFTDALGVSPYAYFMQRRLDEARHLLGSGTSISRAAHGLGFADQSHLSRWFLRVVGVSPGEYARATAAAATPR